MTVSFQKVAKTIVFEESMPSKQYLRQIFQVSHLKTILFFWEIGNSEIQLGLPSKTTNLTWRAESSHL